MCTCLYPCIFLDNIIDINTNSEKGEAYFYSFHIRIMAPKKSDEEVLLDSRIIQNNLEYPKGVLRLMAVVVAFQPIFLSHSILHMSWYSIVNAALFLVVGAITAYFLQAAYMVMIDSEFWRRQRHFNELKNERNENALRTIRIQRAMGYSLFFLNIGFFVLDTFCLLCLFHQFAPELKYGLSSLLSSSLLLLVSEKNEESRQKRLRKHK